MLNRKSLKNVVGNLLSALVTCVLVVYPTKELINHVFTPEFLTLAFGVPELSIWTVLLMCTLFLAMCSLFVALVIKVATLVVTGAKIGIKVTD